MSLPPSPRSRLFTWAGKAAHSLLFCQGLRAYTRYACAQEFIDLELDSYRNNIVRVCAPSKNKTAAGVQHAALCLGVCAAAGAAGC